MHNERHTISRVGWLRAAVLGANDGIVSTASLIVGVSAVAGSRSEVLVAGVAGLVAGAMSMAAGEYVSVSSQADSEASNIARESGELSNLPEQELAELTSIYVGRGLSEPLARKVAEQLTAHNALSAHARDELGISEHTVARPIQAAFTSAATFAAGAALPVLGVVMTPLHLTAIVVSAFSLVLLAGLGALGAKVGGAGVWRATLRVTFWGAFAMALTAGIGWLFGATI
ncbi:VIT family protein [Azospirillum sp. Sh1]|uniref:VIT1/CCC1 transporter family protein n=1 Tax=Azospirillum sp. Sh1 TaxID=2607285 RepID=UPI001FFE63B0|nr:VIT family protein [Azospirillum sp. Sh1]